ncbi:hypothetical protein J7J95_00015 [bacterium]|nr:hypothetical protein [bacterium]
MGAERDSCSEPLRTKLAQEYPLLFPLLFAGHNTEQGIVLGDEKLRVRVKNALSLMRELFDVFYPFPGNPQEKTWSEREELIRNSAFGTFPGASLLGMANGIIGWAGLSVLFGYDMGQTRFKNWKARTHSEPIKNAVEQVWNQISLGLQRAERGEEFVNEEMKKSVNSFWKSLLAQVSDSVVLEDSFWQFWQKVVGIRTHNRKKEKIRSGWGNPCKGRTIKAA